MTELKGYVRADGRVGIRNNVVCIATVMCAEAVVENIYERVPEVVPVVHTDGCETRRVRTLYFTKTLENIIRHPNNYAVMIIGLGCERDNAKEIASRLEKEGVRVWARIVQEDGGCQKVIEEGVVQARKYLAEAAAEEPVSIDASKLVIGVETADHILDEDPLSGLCSDKDRNDKARQTALNLCRWLKNEGASVILPSASKGVFSEIDGSPVHEIHYADPVESGSGFYVNNQDGDRWKGKEDGVFNMDIPESLLSMCASGAQLVVLCTGNSVPIGFPPAPLIKYSSVKDVLGEADVFGSDSDAEQALCEAVCSTVNGALTYEEKNNGHGDLICTYRRTNIY